MENRRPWPSDGLLENGRERILSSFLANLNVQAHTTHVLKIYIFSYSAHSQKSDYFPYAGRVFRSCISAGRSETTLVMFWASTGRSETTPAVFWVSAGRSGMKGTHKSPNPCDIWAECAQPSKSANPLQVFARTCKSPNPLEGMPKSADP